MRFLFSLLFICQALFATATTDYDVVVVGTSPISILEALYQSEMGQRVLVLEENACCGGAWKTITVCGIPDVDLGCHQMGSDQNIGQFLEEYVGCKLVSLENPRLSYDLTERSPTTGFYPSHGCREMMRNLLSLLSHSSVDLQLNTKLESVYINTDFNCVEIKTAASHLTTSKVIISPMSCFTIENTVPEEKEVKLKKQRFHHLYLLIEDPTEWRFTYKSGSFGGCSRLMNLTPFVGLENSGTQLIAIQTHGAKEHQEELYLEELKKQGLIDPAARLLSSEAYIYEQRSQRPSAVHHLPEEMKCFFEVLETNHILSMSKYIPKWKEVLRPFGELEFRETGR